MTRLIRDWLADIEDGIKEYQQILKAKTGLNYAALAAKASGCSAGDIERASLSLKVAVVPVTSGLGMIGSFAQSVAAVVGVMGFQTFVTSHTDVDGIYEAYQNGADMVFIADDNRFISMNLHKKKMADNNNATALGYIAALEGACGTLAGKEVLLLGCGVLGREFLKALKKRGASVSVYDKDQEKRSDLEKEDVRVLSAPEEISGYRYVIDATNQEGWLKRTMLHPDVWLMSPGIPLSLDQDAYRCHSDRVVHDYLQIGVAVMLGLIL
ncbi:3-methylornithyl-N6-L-lysine dehydrogenase PylD [Sinanaerobacter chloroacetimidivorans]|uniref:3-methylornithyl-N6-L-lysine dehydrogenase PylD n=1 Tax=Sinanaerobacter chloroacetimidivorans TaxID=2818044 RepID=A0A8J8B3Y9_9FIRM|nr:3-methylornithyl-N6-L-lysine dehydrogenase PylD [Sinanaerobacter chloroacetimidivorans]MBR0598810.1 3-methylornithyl-N6-L-lysine dehydrogenase PylD [Sinanaerobacter chloroacetimidivorans]